MFPLTGNKIAGLTGVIIAFLLSYFVLFGPDHTLFSVSTWMSYTLKPHEEIFVVFLLPVYMAGMIFGGSVIGWLSARKIYQIFHSS